jgi:hypothetical protein
MEKYKEPKDLREIPLARLKEEGNMLALQHDEWNALFDIESAIRKHQLSELEKWSIFSNRYLLLEREHLTSYKLFTKQEALEMINQAYVQGWQDRRFSNNEDAEQRECEKVYMEKVNDI